MEKKKAFWVLSKRKYGKATGWKHHKKWEMH
jgi:hypothetical protein